MPLRKHLLVLFIIPSFFVVFGVGYMPFDLLNLCDFEDIKKAQLVAGHFHLIRCQRSYYVNPAHVKMLRKGKDGFIYADLGLEDVNPIPVSKTYYDNLAAIL